MVGRLPMLRRYPPALLLSWLVCALAVIMIVVPQVFTHSDPLSGAAAGHLQPPSLRHWCGTDQLGRDVFARIAFGAVHTLSAAVLAASIGLLAGASIGVAAGMAGGSVERVIMGLVDVLLSIPELLLALSVVILTGFGTINSAFAVGLAQIAGFARVVRGDVVRVRHMDFIEAAYGIGGRTPSIVLRHILPNCMTSAASLAVLRFSTAILSISTLSFLGYGAPPPTPEWGLMIAEGRNYLATAWWMTSFPGLAVLLIALASHRISSAMGQKS